MTQGYVTLNHPKINPRNILDSYFKKYEVCSGHDYSRNEVVGQGHSDPKWKTTLRHPKMQPNTKLGIPTSQNIGDMHQTRCMFPETRSEVKLNVTMT